MILKHKDGAVTYVFDEHVNFISNDVESGILVAYGQSYIDNIKTINGVDAEEYLLKLIERDEARMAVNERFRKMIEQED